MRNATPTLDTVVCEAVEIPDPAERAAYLARACGDDTALRERAAALVAAHFRAGGSFLEPAPVTSDSTVASDPGEARVPTAGAAVGPYKLLEQIGEGGMGLVFVAEQSEPVKRRVALKVIKPGMDSRQVVARFEQERQALAVMDHPHIAKVLDAGTTPDGRPYFAMELVRGLPVTRFCDQTRLPLADRLRLFAAVCRAVQHAHTKGVIHRDLKPSNVLVGEVDGQPVPKVIDFGIAKATAGPLTDRTLHTGHHQFVGTPQYMSPEQAAVSGVDVDTRSDVYSLGVLLYELVTGGTPVDPGALRTRGLDEVRRMVREDEPPLPSQRLSTLDARARSTVADARQTDLRRLARQIRGELDWVVLKALEKDRTRRYQSPAELAADVERYLADEPVLAAPPSVGYRLRKLARRHKAALATSGLVLAALVAGTTVSLWQAVEATRARDLADERLGREQSARREAEANFSLARKAVSDTLRGVANEPRLKEEDLFTLRRDLLAKAVPFYEEFVKHRSDDPALEADRGRAYGELAKIRGLMGDGEAARGGYERKRDIFARLSGERPEEPEYLWELGNSHHGLGTELVGLGNGAEAEEAFRRSLAVRVRVAELLPNNPDRSLDVGDCYNDLGALLSDMGRYADATEEYRRATEVYEALAARHPAVPNYRLYSANTHHNVGNLRGQLGDPAAAEKEFTLAQELRLKLAAEFPADADVRMFLGEGHNSFGVLLAGQGRRLEAEGEFRKALAVYKKLCADFPTLPHYRSSLSQAHYHIGLVLDLMGHADRAEPELREGLTIARGLADSFPHVTLYARRLAAARANYAGVLDNLGKPAEAEAEYREAVAVLKKLVAAHPNVPDYAVSLGGDYCNLGHMAREAGRAADAESWYAQAVTTLQAVLRNEPRYVVARSFLENVFRGQGDLATRVGRHADSVKYWDKALELADGPGRVSAVLARAVSFVRLKPAEALVEVERVMREEDLTPDDAYDAARFFAAAASVEKDADRSARHAARAVGLLQQAADGGYFGPPKRLSDLKKDAELAPIRDRDDYRKLVDRLDKPGK